MNRLTQRVPILFVLAAFLAAQGGTWIHRVSHAAEEAEHAAEQACPHRTSDLHLCNASPAYDHIADCVLCTSVAGRQTDPVVLSIHTVEAVLALAVVAPSTLPRVAPEASPPAPRGPPA